MGYIIYPVKLQYSTILCLPPVLLVNWTTFIFNSWISSTQSQLMDLPHKWEKQLAVFCWLAPGYCLCKDVSFPHQHLILAFYPHHINAIGCDYTHMYLCSVTSLLWPASWLYLNWSVFAYCVLVTQSVQETLSLWKSPLPCQTEKRGESVSVLKEFLECYLLLYSAVILAF
jgi:hypothetical protein